MIGTLTDVFEITGRGCVVLVDIESGHCLIGDHLIIGGRSWPVTGIEMPNWGPDAIQRMKEGWKPQTGILLGGAQKSELLGSVGQQVTKLARTKSDGD